MPRVPPHLRRQTCESSLRIDIRQLRRGGLLRPGNHLAGDFSCGGVPIARVDVAVETDAVQLSFVWCPPGASELPRYSQRVAITWTTHHHLPHHRPAAYPWFLCPAVASNGQPCGRRCALLYASVNSPYFACRACRRLAYAVEQEGPSDRRLRAARKARRKLGGGLNLSEPLPPRPRYMHRTRYLRLWGKARLATERWIGQQVAWRRARAGTAGG